MADHRHEGSSGAIDPIVPIDFSPNTSSGKKLRLAWRPVHLLIALFLLASAYAVWFIMVAKSVYVEVDPPTAEITIEGGIAIRLGNRYLIHRGSYPLRLSNEGYHDTETILLVDEQQSQTHPFAMRRLPGSVTFSLENVDDARVQIDGVDVGIAPLTDIPVEAGPHEVLITRARYRPFTAQIDIEGRSQPQAFSYRMEPAWATITLSSQPPGADILVDGQLIGVTPMNAEILEGSRELTLKLAGHKAWQDELEVSAGNDIAIDRVTLVPADGLVFIRSNPSGASVTINDQFKGQTPLEVALTPDQRHEITLFKAGFEAARRNVTTRPNAETEVSFSLEPVTASVVISANPADAELYINGEYRGLANQTLELMAISQQIEIRKQGYVPYTTQFTSRPGLDQAIRVTLKSLEQARLEQIKPEIATAAGQTLKLFYPGAYTMGASRREAGRRPNETLREIQLQRPFYFSLTEVTNGQYKQFKNDHSSGTMQRQSLDLEQQPVVQITWQDAALYCNWLSARESLPAFYQVDNGEVVGFNPDAIGYRLPTEAEWEWIARTDSSDSELRFSWGDSLPPPENAGNFADVSTRTFLGEILQDYNDNFAGSAPVGRFTPNYHGVSDIAGNVAEWVHDFYGAVGSIGGAAEIDPLGPEAGQYHVIRGSSWAHGSVTELRLSFRDFGAEARDDLGFRVARYLE